MDKRVNWYIIFAILLNFNNVYSQKTTETNDSINSTEFNNDSYSDDFFDEYENNYHYEYCSYNKMGEFNLILSFPLAMRNKGFYHKPTGIELSYHKKIKDSQPVYYTFGLSYQWYGHSSLTFYDDDFEPGYPDEWKETWTNNLIGINLGTRYYLPKNIFFLQPYIGLDLKYRLLFAYSSITNVEYAETLESDTHGTNGNFGYSLTLGSLLNFDIPNAFLNLSLSFDSGGIMNYYIKKKETGTVFYVSDYYKKSYIPNSFLTFRIGMTFY